MAIETLQLTLELDQDLPQQLALLRPDHGPYRIVRQSIDARGYKPPKFIYSVEIAAVGENLPSQKILLPVTEKKYEKPLIIGTGPAGLFAALRLAERGIKSILFERGSMAEKRIMSINKFWRYGELNPDDNVCIGEGGAGLYSDGKLITRIRSPHIPYVMQRLVDFGAPPEIEYTANPHVGSDRIRRLIPFFRKKLLDLGCEIYFNSEVEGLLTDKNSVTGLQLKDGRKFHSTHVILAPGHSAENLLMSLDRDGIFMEPKSFAMGIRVEHSQKLINQIQYKSFADHPKLGSANYKLAFHNKYDDIGTFSFCMCPGGFVLSSGTENNRIVTNGMSNYKRNSPFANAAIAVSIDAGKFSKFEGLKLRSDLEEASYHAVIRGGGKKELPAQNLVAFMENRAGDVGPNSSPSGAIAVRLDHILQKSALGKMMYEHLQNSFVEFEKNMRGFLNKDALAFGFETRTSSPVRITRAAESLQSLSHSGLFPVGEGAGYSGGITSSACDGINAAEKIFELVELQKS